LIMFDAFRKFVQEGNPRVRREFFLEIFILRFCV